MSGNSTSQSGKDGRWAVWQLALLVYPFAAGAVAVNGFMLGLMGQALGFRAISPISSIYLGIVFGVPAAIWFAGLLRRWIDEAES